MGNKHKNHHYNILVMVRPCQVNCVSFIKNYKFLYNILIGLVKDLFLNFFVVKDQLLG